MLRWITRFLLAILVLMLLGFFSLAWLGRRPINPASTDPAVDVQPQGSSVSADELTLQAEIAAVPTLGAVPDLPSQKRVTMLVMGVDRRSSADGYTLTDTMLLLSLDPAAEQAAMLSIPRDLYVDIPGFAPNRINTAFILGSQQGGDAAGVDLAMKTIERNLNVRIDHYALLDFDTVINIVDVIGGVTVRVPNTINDPQYPDMNYGFDPFYIEAGEHLLDGETALKYMRSRHGSTDFNRAQRQQQVILAFREQLLQQDLQSMLGIAPMLIEKLSDGFNTDLSTNDIVSLAWIATQIPGYKVSTAVLDYDYVRTEAVENKGNVLILIPEKASEIISQLFY